MNEELNNNSENEEISLIDLLAVLIKYRRLVIFGTLITALLAFSYLYLLPRVTKNSGPDSVEYRYFVHTGENVPSLWNSLDSQVNDLNSIVIDYLNNPLVIMRQNKVTNILFSDSEMEAMSSTEYSNRVLDAVRNGKIGAKASSMKNVVQVTFYAPQNKRELLDEFLSGLIAKLEQDYKNLFMDQLDILYNQKITTIADLTLYNKEVVSADVMESLNKTLMDISAARDITFNFFEIDDTVLEIPVPKPGHKKKFVIIVFAAFFVFIFIAFLLNAIASIKADPKASGKIADAWKAGSGKGKKSKN